MYKESSYFRRIVSGVEEGILATCVVVTAKKRLPLAPTTAAGYDMVVINGGFGYKVGSILNQLCVYAEDALQGQLQLLGGVVGCLQPQNGRADELLKRRDIGGDGLADGEEHGASLESSEYQDQGTGQ